MCSFLLKVVKVSDATVHARSNISGSAKYELVIKVIYIICMRSCTSAIKFKVLCIYLSFQDMLLAFGFKTYFVRASSANEIAIKGAKVTTLSPTKTFPKHVAEDIPIENDVMLFHTE